MQVQPALMMNESEFRRRARMRMLFAAAALPVGLIVGIAAGGLLGAPAIGAAIGAGLGFGVAVVSFAAAVVVRAGDPRL